MPVLALNLAKTAYVLEVGTIVLKGDAKVIAKDDHVTDAHHAVDPLSDRRIRNTYD